MRKVLHVIATGGPGGAETVLADLVRQSPTDCLAVAVIPPGDDWLRSQLPTEQVRTLAPSPRSASGPVDVRYLRGLRRLVLTERPEILHTHSFNTAFYGSLAVLGTRTKVVATFHGAMEVDRRSWRDRAKWRAMRRASRLVCVSRTLEELSRGIPDFPPRRACTIYNGIDLTRFTPAPTAALRTKLGLDADTILVGAVGNVRAPKGYPVLLRSIALLRERGLKLHLALAGDDSGALADELRALRTELALDDTVSLIGFVDDVPNFLNGLDLFVLSSLSEGFSLSTVQALAVGLPVVATRSGGPEEIVVHGTSGLLVAPGSVDALAGGLQSVAQDSSERRRLASAARVRAESAFSVEAMLQAYNTLYDQVLSE